MNNLPKRKAFNFYSSYDEAFEALNEKHQIKLFKAIRDVQFFRININNIEFKETELKFAWLIIKHSIESQILGYCRANKIKYDDTLKDTPKVSREDTPQQVQEQGQVEVQEQVEYTMAKKTNCLVEKTIDYVNIKTNKSFAYGVGNKKHIKSQINKLTKQGFNFKEIEDKFAHVVNVKCAEWLNNSEMKKHLNPVTLFRESNFDKYLNQDYVPTQEDMFNAVAEARRKNAS